MGLTHKTSSKRQGKSMYNLLHVITSTTQLASMKNSGKLHLRQKEKVCVNETNDRSKAVDQNTIT